ncbi:survival motor neuron protein (SMN) domain-containing protein [Ditylenchus destructor]|uniref:Survival motor neuron protein (SMN) domain-containing protein n=1 Tax=Ditylenchus destructor TaxID=166010 RepID=A0AAD4MLK5_9BILA|nr:survival motor neuron protein (SMN) domain-containing protein [Ditylenchus destructor]
MPNFSKRSQQLLQQAHSSSHFALSDIAMTVSWTAPLQKYRPKVRWPDTILRQTFCFLDRYNLNSVELVNYQMHRIVQIHFQHTPRIPLDKVETDLAHTNVPGQDEDTYENILPYLRPLYVRCNEVHLRLRGFLAKGHTLDLVLEKIEELAHLWREGRLQIDLIFDRQHNGVPFIEQLFRVIFESPRQLLRCKDFKFVHLTNASLRIPFRLCRELYQCRSVTFVPCIGIKLGDIFDFIDGDKEAENHNCLCVSVEMWSDSDADMDPHLGFLATIKQRFLWATQPRRACRLAVNYDNRRIRDFEPFETTNDYTKEKINIDEIEHGEHDLYNVVNGTICKSAGQAPETHLKGYTYRVERKVLALQKKMSALNVNTSTKQLNCYSSKNSIRSHRSREADCVSMNKAPEPSDTFTSPTLPMQSVLMTEYGQPPLPNVNTTPSVHTPCHNLLNDVDEIAGAVESSSISNQQTSHQDVPEETASKLWTRRGSGTYTDPDLDSDHNESGSFGVVKINSEWYDEIYGESARKSDDLALDQAVKSNTNVSANDLTVARQNVAELFPTSSSTQNIWKVGMLCNALYSSDGWYHPAKILSISEVDQTCEVLFYTELNEIKMITLADLLSPEDVVKPDDYDYPNETEQNSTSHGNDTVQQASNSQMESKGKSDSVFESPPPSDPTICFSKTPKNPGELEFIQNCDRNSVADESKMPKPYGQPPILPLKFAGVVPGPEKSPGNNSESSKNESVATLTSEKLYGEPPIFNTSKRARTNSNSSRNSYHSQAKPRYETDMDEEKMKTVNAKLESMTVDPRDWLPHYSPSPNGSCPDGIEEDSWRKVLKSTFIDGFNTGYYLGLQHAKMPSPQQPSHHGSTIQNRNNDDENYY